MAGWTTPYYLLSEEFVQRRDEGCEIPHDLPEGLAALDAEADAWNLAAIDPLYDALMALPEDADLAAREPNDLHAICDLRPRGPRDLRWRPTEAELLDRLHGAWTGRCVGCALGKPVERMGFAREEGRLVGRRRIEAYLRKHHAWPLRDYIPAGPEVEAPASCREHIEYMEPDDDVHYTLVGLGVLETHGFDFTWDSIAQYWLTHLPIEAICTAEAQAILNVQNVSMRGRNPSRGAAWVRRHRNPFREWIGAQIRADGWAYACAGHPELAAELAWRDAAWTHERNGIYGEMMMAAIIAASFVEHDVESLIDIGLSEIPRECRLARWVRRCRGWMAEVDDWQRCMERLEAELPAMHPVHTINNALVCLIALRYGALESARAPAIAVMCGLDTDCNGATVGSIVGAVVGRSGFDEALAGRLNDTLRPNMLGFKESRLRDLATRSAALVNRRLA